MEVMLVPIEPPNSGHNWEPFDTFDGFTKRWWDHAVSRDLIYISVQDSAGTEVGRVQLDPAPGLDHYRDLPNIDSPLLEIGLIEVHASHRRHGHATATVTAVATAYPEHRLVAFSEADDFWNALGWSSHIHRDEEALPGHRVLYIQPV